MGGLIPYPNDAMAKIYTKVGDKGQTSLVGGQKVPKSDARIEAYGTIDELNSVVGVVRNALEHAVRKGRCVEALSHLDGDLETLQHWLFDLGSLLATLPADREKYKLPEITPAHIRFFEEKIDAATAIMPPLKNFILPAGSDLSVHLHVARTVARRAERCMVLLDGELPENAIPFLNRISDYLFVMARLCNQHLGVTDVEWKKSVPTT